MGLTAEKTAINPRVISAPTAIMSGQSMRRLQYDRLLDRLAILIGFAFSHVFGVFLFGLAVSERQGQQIVRDGRCGGASMASMLDHDAAGDPGAFGGGVGDEPGVLFAFRRLGRSRLARDNNARNLRGRAGS